MVFPVKKRTTVYVDEDSLLILRIECGVENVSNLVQELIDAYIFDATGDELRAIKREQVRSLTQELKKKRLQQRKLIQEQESSEATARQYMQERIQAFTDEANLYFSDQDGWFKKLPDFDPYGDLIPAWQKAVNILSDHCGFPVTIEECQRFVKSRGYNS